MVLLAKWSDDHVASGKKALSAQMYVSTGSSLELIHSLQEFRLNFSLVHMTACRGTAEEGSCRC